MKKYLSLLLCFVLLLSLTACAGGEKQETTPPPTERETGGEPAAVVITTDAERYTVTVGQMVPIQASTDVETELTYTSADESIATVNKYGKVVGVCPGATEITITAADGTTRVVPVTVEGPLYENVLRVALNVLYNDAVLGCTNTEYGPYVEIYEDGTYTVTFDCTMHLSESSRSMGVTDLSNLTAIFLYDHQVRTGQQMTSGVTACEIRWDSVTVNGQELTITNSEFKSALKSNGIFDTNDPLNAWDGSSVEEVIVDTENHVLNISVEEPITVTVTFTIRGLTFAE